MSSNGILNYPNVRKGTHGYNYLKSGIRAPEYCFSMKQEVSGYSGPLFRVNRQSDGKPYDVYPSFGGKPDWARLKKDTGTTGDFLGTEYWADLIYNQNLAMQGEDASCYIVNIKSTGSEYYMYSTTTTYSLHWRLTSGVANLWPGGCTTLARCMVKASSIRQWWGFVALGGVGGNWSMNYNNAFSYGPSSYWTVGQAVNLTLPDTLHNYAQNVYPSGGTFYLSWYRDSLFFGPTNKTSTAWYSYANEPMFAFGAPMWFQSLMLWLPPLTPEKLQIACLTV